MSTVAKIKCYACNNTFDYYFNTRKSDDQIRCPHCPTEMDHQSQKILITAMGTFDDANRDFRKYNNDRDENLFQFDLVTVENPTDFGFLKLSKKK